jgi:DUF1680 family protein
MTTRREFLKNGLKLSGAASAMLCAGPNSLAKGYSEDEMTAQDPMQEFGYGDVQLAPGRMQTQFDQTQAVLLRLDEDALLQPWRLRAGLPTPGAKLGGWYPEVFLPDAQVGRHGFAPGATFGQWISALARGYAVNHDPATKAKVYRLLDLYEPTISPKFYQNFRFPAYNFDKMVIALIDAHQFAGSEKAFALLDRTTDAAEDHMQPRAMDRDEQRRWRASIGESTALDYAWDEPYTVAENLYLAAQRGAGDRYRKMAPRYLLDETFFDPLSKNVNALPGNHAYSFCNSLSSGMQAYLSDGSEKHLRACSNAFDMIVQTQSYATGGWGPDEEFRTPNTGALYASLTNSHAHFETPCGSYAHFKLTRYLLRVTRDGKYGDSMERVLYNTVLGAKPLQKDGHAFYYSDYNNSATKYYHPDAWPCCSGTLPQVAADYRLLGYFHDSDGVYVNLYLPSTLKWIGRNGAQLSLAQSGGYPLDGRIEMVLKASKAESFLLRLRIPAWAQNGSVDGGTASVRVNGLPVQTTITKGFASLRRNWKDGDRIELHLPLPMRLEAIDAQHPDTVALVRGPLVLFPVTTETPNVSRDQLLAAQQMKEQAAWKATMGTQSLLLLPFTEIQNEHYRAYLTVS